MPPITHRSPSRRLAPLPLALLVPVIGILAAGCRSNTPPEMQNISYNIAATDGPVVIHVRSDNFDERREIPEEHSAYHEGVSPPLGWSGLPPFTRSVVLMVEDPDSKNPKPFVHWLVYNIPANVDDLPQGVPPGPTVPDIGLAAQGQNSAGSVGYFGPKPPTGDPAHHYHFQVFAIDRILDLPPGATRAQLLHAMNGHVVGKGDLVGTYRER
jgi:Raf kinase inhibitor-like YbhB/YbcL family protein